jgi:AcrR family transcriptional regulator
MIDRRSKPRERTRPAVQEAREALYRMRVADAAEGLFAEKGVDSSKMEEIAEEAGVSMGTLYSVFRGKSAILETLHETRLRELLHASVSATRGLDDAVDILVAGVRGYVEYFVAHPDYLRIHIRQSTSWGLPIEGRSPRAILRAEGHATLTRTLERGIEEGAFYRDDPNRLARACAAIGEIRLGDWLVGGMDEAPEEILGDVERQLRRAVCCREEDRA